MQPKKSRAYYQYMLDLTDNKVSYYSSDDISQIIYDLLDDGEAEEAMAACQRGLDQHPEDDYLELVEAKILLHMKRYDEAKKLLKSNPDEQSPFGLGIRFGIDVMTGDQKEAFETLFNHLQKEHLTGLEFVEIIDELFDRLPHHITAEYLSKAAEIVYDRPTKAEEQDAEALGRMGALLMDCNCHRDAIPVLEHALDMDAYDVYSWQDLSRSLFELRMFDECRNSCEMGIAIDPKNPLFNFALGYILFQKGENAEAVEHLEIARQYAEGKLQHEAPHVDQQEAEEQTSITYDLLASAYMALDEFDKARECYEMLVQRIPKYADAYYQLSSLAIDKGNSPEAIDYILKAIQIEPDNTTYLSFYVTLLTELHRFDEALQVLDKLIELEPKSKTYLLAKAELSLNLRHYEEADKAYRLLLKLKPKDSTSRELMRAYFEAIGDNEALKKLNK